MSSIVTSLKLPSWAFRSKIHGSFSLSRADNMDSSSLSEFSRNLKQAFTRKSQQLRLPLAIAVTSDAKLPELRNANC